MNTQPIIDLTLTDAAIHHIKRQIEKRGAGIGIRISVTQTGCSGYAYLVDIVDQPNADDHQITVEADISVFVDPKSAPFITGSKLDFIKKGLNEQFEFSNPNVTALCGCGESFKVD